MCRPSRRRLFSGTIAVSGCHARSWSRFELANNDVPCVDPGTDHDNLFPAFLDRVVACRARATLVLLVRSPRAKRRAHT